MRQEGDRRDGRPGAAAQTDGGEPACDRAASAIAPPASEHREHARHHDRGGEGDRAPAAAAEAAPSLSAREPILVGDAAGSATAVTSSAARRDEVDPAEARASRQGATP